ncbi:MAG: 2-C-methyl-D-erythritol 4-phosphate cytidylyltransferase [Oscillospiraceae bacterium]|nr:2-C-methyl-D-erythritol 4-phosphate cytidylyltransferase [Oscillospiraceae bacterium]
MNIAVIIAGGSGKRTNQDIPKQFMCVENKPIIIYTMEAFQRCQAVDSIVAVCLEGWTTVLEAYAHQFGITKLEQVVLGGATRFDSVYNGLNCLRDRAAPDDIVLLHDANRPLIPEDCIEDSIRMARLHGCALTALPSFDSIYHTSDGAFPDANAVREELYRGQSPESITFGKAMDFYDHYAGKGGSNKPLCGMMLELGETVAFSKGSYRNFKITTAEDFELFQALLHPAANLWIK